jgi:hypothetical protein
VDGNSLSRNTRSGNFDQQRPTTALSEDFGAAERPRSVFKKKSDRWVFFARLAIEDAMS